MTCEHGQTPDACVSCAGAEVREQAQKTLAAIAEVAAVLSAGWDERDEVALRLSRAEAEFVRAAEAWAKSRSYWALDNMLLHARLYGAAVIDARKKKP